MHRCPYETQIWGRQDRSNSFCVKGQFLVKPGDWISARRDDRHFGIFPLQKKRKLEKVAKCAFAVKMCQAIDKFAQFFY